MLLFISLGSNLGNKKENLTKAIQFISKRVGQVKQKSSIYSTEPWGYESFNNYLNQVVEIESEQTPEQIMLNLLMIESEMGRIRHSGSYADRQIDLDILFYDHEILNLTKLTIPHPLLHKRLFILEPLAELAGELTHPILNKSIKQLLDAAKD